MWPLSYFLQIWHLFLSPISQNPNFFSFLCWNLHFELKKWLWLLVLGDLDFTSVQLLIIVWEFWKNPFSVSLFWMLLLGLFLLNHVTFFIKEGKLALIISYLWIRWFDYVDLMNLKLFIVVVDIEFLEFELLVGG